MWKTGVCSISFRKYSIQEIIDATAAAGLDGIEWGGDVHVPVGDTAVAAAVRAATEAAGLQCLSYGGYYRLGSSTPEEFDGLLACAVVLGVRDVRIWAGSKDSEELSAEEWDSLVAEARVCAAKALEKGLVLSLECHNWTLTNDWYAAQKFVEQVNSPALRMYWQPNQRKSETYDLEALRQLVDVTTNVHVFSWKYNKEFPQNSENDKMPLAMHNEEWEKRLTLLEEGLRVDEDHALILEFMPDDRIETLAEEADVLNGWLMRRGLRPHPVNAAETLGICLLPAPKKLELNDTQSLTFAADGILLADDRALYPALNAARRHHLAGLKLSLGTHLTPAVVLKRNEKLVAEGYTLQVLAAENGLAQVQIGYATPAGAFYALMTLDQLLAQNAASLPQVRIADEPDYPVRGYMLDIGRNRVPKREQLFALVDRLASWKINHLELYMEGVPFEYPSFPEMWAGRELLNGEDILALDAYCKDRFIELVPTQNNFGHMDVWLKERFRDLAECPDGFNFHGEFVPDPRCLNPGDPRSLELVQKLADDLLPYFSSEKYNICCDETLELGQGASKEECERRGLEAVYTDFLCKVCEVASKAGRRPLIWDDIIRHDPAALARLPKDVILLDWGYGAAEPGEENLQRLQELGIEYYVCPGTGAWNCYLGFTDKFLANIARSAKLGKKYGAAGLLNTDWGDAGHVQSVSAGYSGMAYGAAMAWGVTENEHMDLAAALDLHVFEDKNRRMGRFVLDVGRYQRYEGRTVGNVTQAMWQWFTQQTSALEEMDPASFGRVTAYLDSLVPTLEASDMRCPDAALVKEEYRFAIRLVKTACLFSRAAKAQQEGDTVLEKELWPQVSLRAGALAMEFGRIWLMRCKQSWLASSVQQFQNVKMFADRRLAELKEKEN